MELAVHITKADIRKGRRTCCDLCPAAIAINRALSDTGDPDYYATVGGRFAIFIKHDRIKNSRPAIRVCDIPSNAQWFVYRFDNRQEVDPIHFTLKLT